jgi:hypothetical protein
LISDELTALIDQRADAAIAEIRRLAESARRSIGQRTRYALQRVKEASA